MNLKEKERISMSPFQQCGALSEGIELQKMAKPDWFKEQKDCENVKKFGNFPQSMEYI